VRWSSPVEVTWTRYREAPQHGGVREAGFEFHGEGAVEKLVGGQYTSAMVNGKFVAPGADGTSAG
jgi:hypothetical protein